MPNLKVYDVGSASWKYVSNIVNNATYAAGSLALGNNVTSGSVTGLGLGFTPSRVVVSIARPAGGDFIFACVNTGTITTGGFDFELSAATTSTSFVLEYAMFA